MDLEKIEHCVLCGSDKLEPIYETRDRHYGMPGEYTIDKCANCSLVFLNPMPTEAYLTSLYPETYYSYQDFYEKKASAFKRFYKKYLVNIRTKDPKFNAPGKILDVGCGSGQFLFKLKKNGWEVAGVEVNAAAAKLGNELENLNIFIGSIEAANFPANHFDYVRSNHSLEHITNPDTVIAEMYRVLKPGGKLFIGVPNIESFNGRLFKKYWWYLGAPAHTFNYSVKTLKRLVEKHGFTVERVNYNGDFSGVLGSFQIYLNRNNGKKSHEGFFFNNKLLVVLSQQIARLLNVFKKGDAIEIICTKK